MNDPYDTTAGTSGTTWKYVYDQGGNIQSKTAYAFTTGTVGSAVKTDSFTYGDTNWKDKLTAFNGQAITYDAIGNPTSDGTWNYTWYGRQMRAIHKGEFGEQGYDEITFEYNEKGLRTKKTRMYYDDATGDIGYKATNYTLHGKNIVHLSDGSNNLHFFYDAQNRPCIVLFNGTAYAYLYNLQGDVIGLVDSNGAKMVSYTYDAWGKPISKTGTLASTLGTIQPFRYRGYVYDEESGLYYVGHRFFNANISRFISADANLNSGYVLFPNNQFCYCLNNPVMGADYDGCAASFGYFHALVQADFIATHPGVTAELGFYKYGDRTRQGRADLVNLATGDVWEIKPHMAGYNRNPVKYLNRAQKQLESYIEGEITNGKKREQLNGANLHPGYAFSKRTIYDELTDMDITYWSEGDGIVWYEVSKRQYFEPALVPAPEKAKEKSYSSYAQPSVSYSLGPVIAIILTAAAWLFGMPTPGFAY